MIEISPFPVFPLSGSEEFFWRMMSGEAPLSAPFEPHRESPPIMLFKSDLKPEVTNFYLREILVIVSICSFNMETSDTNYSF